jgi:hypothetical protein
MTRFQPMYPQCVCAINHFNIVRWHAQGYTAMAYIFCSDLALVQESGAHSIQVSGEAVFP